MISEDPRQLLQALPQGVIQLSEEGTVLGANPSACRFLGAETHQLMGQPISSFFPPEQLARLEPILKQQNESGVNFILNNRVVRAFTKAMPQGSTRLLLLDDITQETFKMEQMVTAIHDLEEQKLELEGTIKALQLVETLAHGIEYPYSYLRVLNSVLQTVPELFPVDACVALVDRAEQLSYHLHLTRDIGETNAQSLKRKVLEQFARIKGTILDPADATMHFTGVTCGLEAECTSISSLLTVPLYSDETLVGVLMCASTATPGFTALHERLLKLFVERSFSAVAETRTLLDVERRKLEAMVESMVDGVLMTDENDEIVIMNQAARKILRVSRRDDNVNKKYFEETLGFYPFRLTKGMIHKTGLQATIKEEIKVFDKTLHSVVAPVYDSDGTQTGTVVVLRDITERKELEERKNDFLSVISHELRTPLASIGGSIDLVLENIVGEINDKQRRYLELAKDSCQKLNVVIDDLLDISKFEKGKMEIRMEMISIIQLVEEVAEKFQPYAIEKEILLKLEKPAQDIRIFGDYNRLVQVLNNLLSNAIKFTPSQGEVEIRVFQPKVLSPHVGISVKDTGPGIRVEDLERVFDKFEQVRRSDTRKIGGTGLGLAISRSIIEAHRGKIWAESKPGEGAKFIFLLPVEKRNPMPSEVYAELASVPTENDCQALIVAGDADSGYLLKGILLERGLKVTLTYNAQDAFAEVGRRKTHLVLIDLDPDQTSGLQFIDILSHDPETAHIPVISFSRLEQPRLVPFPNVIHVPKPIEINRFLQALSSSMLKTRGETHRKTILLVDDDPNLRMICREALEFQNYNVVEAADGKDALQKLKQERPDLILLDIMLPEIDGFQLAQIIRSNISTSHIPIIFLTAKGQTEDKVRALKTGASDYLVKPIDSTELSARIETIMERTENELAASPTTKLPGSVAIEKEINHLIAQNQKFALCYLDLDNLKSYNDQYGYAKADGVVKQTGDIIRETVLRLGHPTDFVGHIAGDDFLFITHPELADRIGFAIIEQFDQIIPYFYKPEDRQRGFIEATDRFGVLRKFPLLSISIVCMTNEEQELIDHLHIATLAAEYKRIAKAMPGSTYMRNGKVMELPGRRV